MQQHPLKAKQTRLPIHDELFRRVHDASPDGFMIFRSLRSAAGEIEDFECLYANPAAAAIAGRPADQLPRRRLLPYFSGSRRERMLRTCQAVIETGEPWKGLLRHPRLKPGRWFQATLVRLDDGFAATFSDVTRATRAERERAHKVAVLECADEGIFGLDIDGCCTFINRSAAEMLGFTPREVLGENMHRLIHHHRADGSLYPLDECPAHKSVCSGKHLRLHDEVLWRKDGSHFPVEYSSSPIIRKGEIRGAVVAFTDITALKQAEETLRIRARQQEAVAELGQRALAGSPLVELLEDTVQLVRETLRVEDVRVVEFGADGDAGVGRGVESDGRSPGGSGEGDGAGRSPAEPKATENPRTDARLWESPPLQDAASSIAAVVIGSGARPFGLLSAAAAPPRSFTADDVNFLQSLANVMGAAVEREQAERELKQLLRQQTAVAEFGFRALAGWDATLLMRGASTLLRETLAVDYTSFLEILPGGEEFVLRAGAGWDGEPVDHVTVRINPADHAGYTLLSGEPVIIEDLRTETRFHESALLEEAAVRSGISVIVSGRDRPLGVLGAYSTTRRRFRQNEVDLLQSIANLLAQAIERRQTEEVLWESEKQFRQAQKMEAVGRLAGGVAHDFNNLLTVIKGNAEMGLMELASVDPLRDSLDEIVRAANRAADLTRQLLAFSRRQVLQPKVLDLNATVSATERLLRRVLGENVTLKLKLEPELGKILADPGQIEQVLLNLVVNARDAMPVRGTLTIGTRNVELTDTSHANYPYYVRPGTYVQLSVSDTGVGMDEVTLSRLFEPFFTTKDPGKGTGLGLSTVYGIIKQSEGYVWAESKPGEGSTFHLLLHRITSDTQTTGRHPGVAEAPAGLETVLLVEDESSVRSLTRRILERRGYTVLEAADADEAMQICARHRGLVHLALTDVILPGESGRALAERLAVLSPETKVLYMSGYTDEVIAQHGVLEPGTRLLEKPFSPLLLLRRVREVLDEGKPAPTAEQ